MMSKWTHEMMSKWVRAVGAEDDTGFPQPLSPNT